MNKKNILRVADAIEKGELVKRGIGFNMGNWCDSANNFPDLLDGCGTVACIAGWTYFLAHPKAKLRPKIDIWPFALNRLGLSRDQGDALFFARSARMGRAHITPTHAVAVLRHLAETGEVDWSVGAPS